MAKFKLISRKSEISQRLSRASEAAIYEACLLFEGRVKSLTPVDTGALRDSFSSTVVRETPYKVTGQTGSPLTYAIYQEYGTGEYAINGQGRKGGWTYKAPNGKFYRTLGTRPKRFFSTAYKNSEATMIKRIQDRLREALS